jgi:hypothetical protein
MIQDDRLSKRLLTIASPDLYRLNSFRILGLVSNASYRDILGREREILQAIRRGEDVKLSDAIFPVGVPLDEDTVREASGRLSNSICRFVEEFFWFWPLESAGASVDEDPALSKMKESDYDGAKREWEKRLNNDERTSLVCHHNLAVLNHALALDMEYIALKEGLDERQREQKHSYWERAYEEWKACLEREELLCNHLEERIKELRDPILRPDIAPNFCSMVPIYLLYINARLVVEAINHNKKEEASKHIELINNSGFAEEHKEEALRLAITPIRERIDTLCNWAKQRTQEAPKEAGEVATELINRTKGALLVIDSLLPKGHPIREKLHDDIAKQLLQSLVVFARETEDWQTSLNLLESAREIVEGQDARRDIEENIKIVKDILLLSRCWFCGSRPADDDCAVSVLMHGNVVRIPTWQGVLVQWQKTTIKVPRCRVCKEAHKRQVYIASGAVLGTLLGIGGCIASLSAEASALIGFLVFGGFIIVGTAIGAILSKPGEAKGIKPESAATEFPLVQQYKSQGWEFGEKPPGVQ